MLLNFEDIVKEALNESVYIVEGGKKKEKKLNAYNTVQKDILDRVKDLYKSKDPSEHGKVEDALKQSSVRLDVDSSIAPLAMAAYQKIDADDINADVELAASELRNLVTPNGGLSPEFNELPKDKQYELLRLKKFLDMHGLTYLYDSSYKRSSSSPRYGIKRSKDITDYTDSDLGKFDIRDTTFRSETNKMHNFGLALKRYMMTKYGVGFSVPGFSTGNKKVVNTLIVNFASALGCPAWNNCIVKHACYARSDEKGAHGHEIFPANEKRNFLWLITEHDDVLKELMFNYLRVTAVNYDAVYRTYKNFLNDTKGISSLSDFIKIPFSEWDDELIEYIKANKLIKVRDIRFNENGDFLSQGILDMADEIAGDFKYIGINSSAYTCRKLNYSNIKNIILNASRANLDTSDPNGGNFARMFFAFTPEVWDALPSTWIPDTENQNQVGFSMLSANGGKHGIFKCPCGKKVLKFEKVNCGQCHFCYEPKQEGFDKIYVLVSAHGGDKEQLNDKAANAALSQIGRFDDENVRNEFKDNLRNFIMTNKGKKNVDVSIAYGVLNNALLEMTVQDDDQGQILQANSDLAINIICDHAIASMNQITQNMGKLAESKENAKNNFNMILEKISKK